MRGYGKMGEHRSYREISACCQTLLHRSAGSSTPVRTPTTGTRSSSPRIDAMSGSIPPRWVMTTRSNQADAVFLRSKANCVSSFINSSVRTQSTNARIFSVGEAEGFNNKAERRSDRSVSRPTANVSRAGKDDICWNTTGSGESRNNSHPWMSRQNRRMLARGSRGNSTKGIFESGSQKNEVAIRSAQFNGPWADVVPHEGG